MVCSIKEPKQRLNFLSVIENLIDLQVVEDHERLTKMQVDIERKNSFNVKGLSVFHTVLEVCA